jgi:hypothetical protein
MKRILAIAIVVAAALTASASAQQMKSNFGIKIYGCNVVQNGNNLNTTAGAWLNYTNTRGVPATEVDFVVRYNGVPSVMVDTGNFTQYAQIQHTLKNALIGQAWTGQTPELCRVYRVVWANGKVSK